MSRPKIKLDYQNYRRLVDQSEQAFHKERYLEAFLIQSCIVEGVIKAYALSKLPMNEVIQKKFMNFELARILDDLLMTGKIEEKIYKNLSDYKNKRNDVIHNLVLYSEEELKPELIKAYELGKEAKGFIVDDIQKLLDPSLRSKEIWEKIEELKIELAGYHKGPRSATATQAEIYNLLIELTTIADSDLWIDELQKMFPNFDKKTK